MQPTTNAFTAEKESIFLSAYFARQQLAGVANVVNSPYPALIATMRQFSHPNEVRQSEMYKRMIQGLGDKAIMSDNCNNIIACPEEGHSYNAPSPVSFIPDTSIDDGKIYMSGGGIVSVGYRLDKQNVAMAQHVGRRGVSLVIKMEKFDQRIGHGVRVGVTLHSDPIDLGDMDLQPDGSYLLIPDPLPDTIPVGLHKLHIAGLTDEGKQLLIESPVFC